MKKTVFEKDWMSSDLQVRTPYQMKSFDVYWVYQSAPSNLNYNLGEEDYMEYVLPFAVEEGMEVEWMEGEKYPNIVSVNGHPVLPRKNWKYVSSRGSSDPDPGSMDCNWALGR